MKLYIVIINKLGFCNAFEGHISASWHVFCDVILGPWVSLIPRENFTAKFAWAMLPAENNMMYIGIHIHTRVFPCNTESNLFFDIHFNMILYSSTSPPHGMAIVAMAILCQWWISGETHYTIYNLLTFIIDLNHLIDHVYSTEKTQI